MRQPFRIWEDIYIVGSSDLSHPYDCCVYLIDAGEIVLIDAGAGRSFDRLVDNIQTLGFIPERIGTVIATHGHIDHVGSLSQFKTEYGAKIVAHALGAKAIETGNSVGAEFYGVDYQPCQVDIRIEKSEQSLNFGKHRFNIVHIPGHTPGSVVVHIDIAGKRVLFGQDIHGPYERMWGGHPDQAIESLRKLIDLEADILCEGHFGIYQPASEVTDYIEGYLQQLEQKARDKH